MEHRRIGSSRLDTRHLAEGTAGLGRDEDRRWRDRFGHRGDMSREGSSGLGGAHGPKGWNEALSFAGRGPRGYKRPDESIYEDVCERLTADPELDASDVEVAVMNGTVVLAGTVSSRQSRYLAEDISMTVLGVDQVYNQLRVRPSRPLEEGSLELQGSAPHEGIGVHAVREREKRGPRRIARRWVAR